MSAYENTARGGDTNFRRKWDREEYAKRAAEREVREKAESKARYEAKLAGKKYVAKDDLPEGETKTITARKAQDWSDVVNKTYLVPFGASAGRRGKGAGFYCEACDETYKDNNAWIDHINSRQHLRKTGQSYDQTKSTLEECVARLEMLKQMKKAKEVQAAYDIDSSLKVREEREQEERAAKKARKLENKQKAKESIKQETLDTPEDEVARIMGIKGFK